MLLRLLAIFAIGLTTACATVPDRSDVPFQSDRISVEVRGSGPDVVLVPGLGSSPAVWQDAVAAVPGYRYHLVHVAGFAGAPAARNAQGAVVAPVGEEIARYVEAMHLRRPAVVGHSLGGLWAMGLAARHPELVSRVMVVDMLPFPGVLFGGPSATPQALASTAAQLRQVLAAAAGEQRRQLAETTIAGMVRTEARRAGPIADYLASDPQVVAQAMSELVVTDLRPELANIRVPLTVLWVRNPSVPVTEEQMAQVYRDSFAAAPQARVVRVPDAYHFIMLDEPARFQAALREFLAAR
jgi:pimeloyl-ACP methyl ester carboxylesterase